MAISKDIKRSFLFCFILLWLAGAGMLGVGIWFTVDSNLNDAKIVTAITHPAKLEYCGYFLIAGGGALVLFSIIGFLAVAYSARALLGFLSFLIICALVLPLVCGAFSLWYRDAWANNGKNELIGNLTIKYNNASYKSFRESMDKYQTSEQCCGVDKYTDYVLTPIPNSCCTTPPCTAATAYGVGCYPDMLVWINKYTMILTGVGLGFGCGLVGTISLVVFVAACCLVSRSY